MSPYFDTDQISLAVQGRLCHEFVMRFAKQQRHWFKVAKTRTSEEMDGTLPRIASFEYIVGEGGSYYTPGLDGG